MTGYKKRIALLMAFAIGTFLFSCKDDGGPPPPNGPDTTSHNFVFSLDTLGDGNSSVLNDVAIINDTLVYAVGKIYSRDSMGQVDPFFDNIAKWNAKQWTLQKLLYNGGPFAGRWLLAFNENDVWVNEHAHWDGVRWNFLFVGDPIFNGIRTNKAWGTSSRDFYVVGDGGFIAHYNGSSWQRVESGTTIDLRDIHGTVDGGVVWVSGYRNDYSVSILLQLRQQQVRTVLELSVLRPPREDTLSGTIASIWTAAEHNALAATSGGMYRIGSTSRYGEATRMWFPAIGTAGFFNCVRASAWNNAIVVGDFGTVAHFNGASWYQYNQFFNMHEPPAYRFASVSVGDRLVFAVGTIGARAVALQGKR